MNRKERFLRCIGVMTEEQLEVIRHTKIAIGGLGLGGSIFLNLVRLGFEKFHIADPDTFERTNINRQRLAKESTIGARKDQCSLQEALDINPDVQVKLFPPGVQNENLNEFLTGVDWAVDVIDLFALPQKLAFNAEARRRNIPVSSCATLGFTGCMVVFNKNTPSFAELTGMHKDAPYPENLKKFFQFICPEIPEYMREQIAKSMDRSSYIPFVVPGGEIAAAFCATEIVKNILKIGDQVHAPRGVFIDSFHLKIEVFEASHHARSLEPSKTAPRIKKAA
jgi:molybdopterin/thiamine biosynthesis adenylyltransferase